MRKKLLRKASAKPMLYLHQKFVVGFDTLFSKVKFVVGFVTLFSKVVLPKLFSKAFFSKAFFFTFIITMFTDALNFSELVTRAIKYLVEGLMVAIAAFAIPKRSLNLDEITLIALTAAATFSILDTYVPSMGVSARSGAGFGIGANLVGFPRAF